MSTDNLNVTVKSFGGARICELTNQLKVILSSSKYDVLVVHVGTNDIAKRTLEGMIQDYDALIQTAKSLTPGIQILISSLLPRPFNEYENNLTQQFNAMLCSLANWLNLSFIDNSALFIRNGEPLPQLYWDEVHPNTNGMHLLSDNIMSYIRTVMNIHHDSIKITESNQYHYNRSYTQNDTNRKRNNNYTQGNNGYFADMYDSEPEQDFHFGRNIGRSTMNHHLRQSHNAGNQSYDKNQSLFQMSFNRNKPFYQTNFLTS